MGDIYPLRESTYEGVPALIPYAYDTVLEEEYEKKAFTLLEFEGYGMVSPAWQLPTRDTRAHELTLLQAHLESVPKSVGEAKSDRERWIIARQLDLFTTPLLTK